MDISNNARRLAIRLEKLSNENKKIARDMTVVAVFALAAKFIAALKEIAIAWRYGVSEVVDAYLFVFNLVAAPISIWYSILTVVFVPLAARLRLECPEQLPIFRSELFGIAILIGIVLGLVGWGGLIGLFHSSLSGLPEEVTKLALDITPWMSVLIPLGIVTHWGSVKVMSEGQHANTLFEGIPALALLVTVVVVSSSTITPLVWGTVIGATCHMCVAVLRASKGQWRERPRFSMRSPAWRVFWGGMGVMLLGQVFQTLTGIVDQFYAARLEAGAVATLGYANRVLSLILTLGATAVGRAVLPVFSGMQEERGEQLYAMARKWAQLMLVAGFVVLSIGWPAAQWTVGMLFERGAFTSTDTMMVADVFRYAITQLPFYFASLVIVYCLLSRGSYRAAALIGAMNLVMKVLFAEALVPLLGLNGLMLATTAMYLVSCLVAWRLLRV